MSKDQSRVLARNGARELNHQEMEAVTGGVMQTLTACTFAGVTAAALDGDIGEC